MPDLRVPTARTSTTGTPVRMLLALLAAVTVLAGCAPGPTAAGPGTAPELGFERYQLANGLDVILRRDERVPIASINLQYHVGPADEGPGRTGFAHLFEHMMFQGSGHTGADTYFAHLEALGATNVNGHTTFDDTTYTEDVPANALETALWLESDRMGFLLNSLDAAQLANQQAVVRNERRENTESVPYGLSGEAVYQLLFPAGHPYHAGVIGSHTDIQAARLADVRDFFRRYYVPDNASLAIVGNIDVAATKALVQKYFGSIPRGPRPPEPRVAISAADREQRLTVTDQVELPAVTMAWVTPPIYAPGDADADIAAYVLGGSATSRFHRKLVHDTGIAQDVSAGQQSLRHGSVFTVSATAAPGHTADELETALQRELDALAATGPTPDEVATARTMYHSSAVFGLEHPADVAALFNQYEHDLGDPGAFDRDQRRYDEVGPDSVRRFVADQLTRTRRVVVHTVPGPKVLPPDPPAPDAPAATDPPAPRPDPREDWRYTVPVPGPSPAVPLPAARRLQLANGLPVYLVERHGLPVAYASLVSRWGSSADPLSQPGLADFTLDMLDKGTAHRDAMGISREVEALGATLGSSSGIDGGSIGVAAPSPRLDAAMTVLADVARNPSFPADELERERGELQVGQRQQQDDPSAIADTVLTRELFGQQNSVGRVGSEVGRALPTITRADLQRFHDAAFTPQTTALILAGDLTPEQAVALATAHFGDWRGNGVAPPAPGPAVPSPDRVFVVDQPGSGQTTLLLGQPGVTQRAPDLPALTVLNTVLGGGFSSRINMNLRERHGYTYGASSSLVSGRDLGLITLSTSTRADVSAAAVQQLLTEVTAVRDSPVGPAELAQAKDSLSRSLPAAFTTAADTAGTVGSLYLDDLPPDYYQQLPARIAAVDAADVQAAARAHLDPDRMTIVAVGDRATLDPQLTAAGLGPIAHRAPDGDPLPQG